MLFFAAGGRRFTASWLFFAAWLGFTAGWLFFTAHRLRFAAGLLFTASRLAFRLAALLEKATAERIGRRFHADQDGQDGQTDCQTNDITLHRSTSKTQKEN